MIDFKNGTILSNGDLIQKWVVWFRSPFGLHDTLKEAKEKVESIDGDPNLLIQPVAVAVSASGLYEIKE